jgi:hypothetical protein
MAAPDPGGFSGSSRREVHQILSQPQFQTKPQRSIDPLGGVITTLGRWISDVVDPPARWLLRHLVHPTGNWFHSVFGAWWPYVALAIAVVAGIAIGAVLAHRRQRPDVLAARRIGAIEKQEPGDLEKLADEAEASGDLQRAVRLRFRAGVLRLEQFGALRQGSTRTNGEIRRTLRSPTFDSLAADLESIVYGGAAATAAHAVGARDGWPVVVKEARDKVTSGADAA